jgi:hypothetical protein
MPLFVHLTAESRIPRIRRNGIARLRKAVGRSHEGVYAVPVTRNFYASHQWLRESKRRNQGPIAGVYFRVPDEQLVWVGHYGQAHRFVIAAEAIAQFMKADDPFGWEVGGPSGAALEHRLLIDNKDKAAIGESDIRKLVRDAKERHTPVGIIVARDETQLRQTDRECRWAQEDGIWILRTTRQWLRRDLWLYDAVVESLRHRAAPKMLVDELSRVVTELRELAMVSAADKLHNARAVLADYRELGEALWSRFNAPKEDQLWYYGALVAALQGTKAPKALVEELRWVVGELKRIAK